MFAPQTLKAYRIHLQDETLNLTDIAPFALRRWWVKPAIRPEASESSDCVRWRASGKSSTITPRYRA